MTQPTGQSLTVTGVGPRGPRGPGLLAGRGLPTAQAGLNPRHRDTYLDLDTGNVYGPYDRQTHWPSTPALALSLEPDEGQTQAQVQAAVQAAFEEYLAGSHGDIDAAAVNALIDAKLADFTPDGVDSAAVQAIVDAAVADLPTTGEVAAAISTAVSEAIAALPPDAVTTTAQVQAVVDAALADFEPGMDTAAVQAMIDAAIDAIPEPPAGLTIEQVNAAVTTALAPYALETDVATDIAAAIAALPADEVTDTDQVTAAIAAALAALPPTPDYVDDDEMTAAIAAAIAGLPTGGGGSGPDWLPAPVTSFGLKGDVPVLPWDYQDDVATQPADPGEWDESYGVVGPDGKVYLVGGGWQYNLYAAPDNSGYWSDYLQRLWVYDPATNTWDGSIEFPKGYRTPSENPMGVASDHPYYATETAKGAYDPGLVYEGGAGGFHDGKLYILIPENDCMNEGVQPEADTLAGFIAPGDDWSFIASFFEYDFTTQTWTRLPNLGAGEGDWMTSYAASAVVGDKLYVLGMDSRGFMWVYDFIAGTWSRTAAPAPVRYSDGTTHDLVKGGNPGDNVDGSLYGQFNCVSGLVHVNVGGQDILYSAGAYPGWQNGQWDAGAGMHGDTGPFTYNITTDTWTALPGILPGEDVAQDGGTIYGGQEAVAATFASTTAVARMTGEAEADLDPDGYIVLSGWDWSSYSGDAGGAVVFVAVDGGAFTPDPVLSNLLKLPADAGSHVNAVINDNFIHLGLYNGWGWNVDRVGGARMGEVVLFPLESLLSEFADVDLESMPAGKPLYYDGTKWRVGDPTKPVYTSQEITRTDGTGGLSGGTVEAGLQNLQEQKIGTIESQRLPSPESQSGALTLIPNETHKTHASWVQLTKSLSKSPFLSKPGYSYYLNSRDYGWAPHDRNSDSGCIVAGGYDTGGALSSRLSVINDNYSYQYFPLFYQGWSGLNMARGAVKTPLVGWGFRQGQRGILVVGGEQADGTVLKTVSFVPYNYQLDGGEIALPDSPYRWRQGIAVYRDSVFHVFGTSIRDDDTDGPFHMVYDPATDTWREPGAGSFTKVLTDPYTYIGAENRYARVEEMLPGAQWTSGCITDAGVTLVQAIDKKDRYWLLAIKGNLDTDAGVRLETQDQGNGVFLGPVYASPWKRKFGEEGTDGDWAIFTSATFAYWQGENQGMFYNHGLTLVRTDLASVTIYRGGGSQGTGPDGYMGFNLKVNRFDGSFEMFQGRKAYGMWQPTPGYIDWQDPDLKNKVRVWAKARYAAAEQSYDHFITPPAVAFTGTGAPPAPINKVTDLPDVNDWQPSAQTAGDWMLDFDPATQTWNLAQYYPVQRTNVIANFDSSVLGVSGGTVPYWEPMLAGWTAGAPRWHEMDGGTIPPLRGVGISVQQGGDNYSFAAGGRKHDGTFNRVVYVQNGHAWATWESGNGSWTIPFDTVDPTIFVTNGTNGVYDPDVYVGLGHDGTTALTRWMKRLPQSSVGFQDRAPALRARCDNAFVALANAANDSTGHRRLHVFGGSSAPKGDRTSAAANADIIPVEDSHHIYDPATDTWSVGTPMPGPLAWATAVVAHLTPREANSPGAHQPLTKVHVFGIAEYPSVPTNGHDSAAYTERARIRKWYVWDPATDTWTDRSSDRQWNDAYTADSHFSVAWESSTPAAWFSDGYYWHPDGRRGYAGWSGYWVTTSWDSAGQPPSARSQAMQSGMSGPSGTLTETKLRRVSMFGGGWQMSAVGGWSRSLSYDYKTEAQIAAESRLLGEAPTGARGKATGRGVMGRGLTKPPATGLGDMVVEGAVSFNGMSNPGPLTRVLTLDSSGWPRKYRFDHPAPPIHAHSRYMVGWTMDPAAAKSGPKMAANVVHIYKTPVTEVEKAKFLTFGIVEPGSCTHVRIAIIDRKFKRVKMDAGSDPGGLTARTANYIEIAVPASTGSNYPLNLRAALGTVMEAYAATVPAEDLHPYVYIAVEFRTASGTVETNPAAYTGPTMVGADTLGSSLSQAASVLGGNSSWDDRAKRSWNGPDHSISAAWLGGGADHAGAGTTNTPIIALVLTKEYST